MNVGKEKKILFRTSKELARKLKVYCAKWDLTMEFAINEALEEYLKYRLKNVDLEDK